MKSVLSRPAARHDGAAQPLGRQREIGVAGEIARQELGRVGDDAGRAVLHRRQHLLVAGDHDVAAEHEIGAAAPRSRMAWMSSGLLAMRMWL